MSKPLDAYGKIYVLMMEMLKRRMFGFGTRKSLKSLMTEFLGSTESIGYVVGALGRCPVYKKNGLKILMVGMFQNDEIFLRLGKTKGYDKDNELRDVFIGFDDWYDFVKKLDARYYYRNLVSKKTKDMISEGVFKNPIFESRSIANAIQIREEVLKYLKKEIHSSPKISEWM